MMGGHGDLVFRSDNGMVDNGMVDVGTLAPEYNAGDIDCSSAMIQDDYNVGADEDKCTDDELDGTLRQGEDVVVGENIDCQEDTCNEEGFGCWGSTLSHASHVAGE